ncbi:MAG: transposase [Candidatus Dormibacteraeota bacterium]|nr:transposase [Candidatus Dormibacteraeota bacterium]
MRYPGEWYRLAEQIGQHFGDLRPAQRRGLTTWVYGTLLAGSGCQTAVLTALEPLGGRHAVRQVLREWLYDGKDKAAPCRPQVEVGACFAPLLRWVVSWWQGKELALAVDATAQGDALVVLAVSVVYRGSAIPVAWHVLAANVPGAWLPHFQRLLQLLAPAVPADWRVIVMADRGLWSPALWDQIVALGWHPLPRIQEAATFQPTGRARQPVRAFVDGPDEAWVGTGVAFVHHPVACTLVVTWLAGHAAPCATLTDLAPAEVGICWYGLRFWIERGFCLLKSLGWGWEQTRRTDPDRVARHWLVLAVALLWTLATGTRVEDADAQDTPPSRVRHPPAQPPLPAGARTVSLFRRGLLWLRRQLGRARLWRCLWLLPERWPAAPPGVRVTYHAASP